MRVVGHIIQDHRGNLVIEGCEGSPFFVDTSSVFRVVHTGTYWNIKNYRTGEKCFTIGFSDEDVVRSVCRELNKAYKQGVSESQ